MKAGECACWSASEKHRAVLTKSEAGELIQPCLPLGALLVESDVQLSAACPGTVPVLRNLTWREVINFSVSMCCDSGKIALLELEA